MRRGPKKRSRTSQPSNRGTDTNACTEYCSQVQVYEDSSLSLTLSLSVREVSVTFGSVHLTDVGVGLPSVARNTPPPPSLRLCRAVCLLHATACLLALCCAVLAGALGPGARVRRETGDGAAATADAGCTPPELTDRVGGTRQGALEGAGGGAGLQKGACVQTTYLGTI